MNKNDFYSKAIPLLQAAVAELQLRLEGVKLTIDSSSPGGIAISAFFDTTRADTDLLQLIVSFIVDDDKELMDAQVIWGHDSLYVEAEYSEKCYVDVTSENLEQLLSELPRLVTAFKVAVIRGRPLL